MDYGPKRRRCHPPLDGPGGGAPGAKEGHANHQRGRGTSRRLAGWRSRPRGRWAAQGAPPLRARKDPRRPSGELLAFLRIRGLDGSARGCGRRVSGERSPAAFRPKPDVQRDAGSSLRRARRSHPAPDFARVDGGKPSCNLRTASGRATSVGATSTAARRDRPRRLASQSPSSRAESGRLRRTDLEPAGESCARLLDEHSGRSA
jgi:hypothetical protein